MAKEKENISELVLIQTSLKAPKSQRNAFGGYNYRSCEDILEAVKPLLLKTNSALTISDDIVEVGGRIYVQATATLITPSGTYSNKAFAREPLSKKGMDDSQITGTASSYARKYSLNGLFAIDDTKDADALNVSKEYTQPADPLQEAFEILKPEIENAPNRDYLNMIHAKNAALHNYAPYRAAMNKRVKEVS